MKYDFTTLPDKKNQGSAKWAIMYELNPDVADDVVPLSVADMELKNPPEITEGLKKYLDEVVLGYSRPYPGFINAVIDWQKNRHGYDVKPEWFVNVPGVVNAFTGAIRAFTEKGDGVIIFRPIYYPMGNAIKNSELTEVNVPLLNDDGVYTIDFDAFEEAAADPKNKVLLFSSPHNPTGRVWTEDELRKIGEICLKNDVIIVSDEIWNDLIMPGYKHTVFASLSPEIENITVTMIAPSKTFNIAGLATSICFVSNEVLKEKLINELSLMGSLTINTLGFKGCELAYTKCESWLEELLKLLETNRAIGEEFFNSWGLKCTRTEGTYLLWVNFASLGFDVKELEEFLQKEAQFFTNAGYVFGEEGNLYERINIALPTEKLKVQLDKLDKALKKIGK